MSNNILTYTGSGKTMYFIVLNSSGLYWKGNGFEIRNTSHWGQYVYMMTETSPGLYYGTFPSALGAGLYYIVGYRMIGGVASPTDTIERIGTMDWTGTEEFVGGNSGGGSSNPFAVVFGTEDDRITFVPDVENATTVTASFGVE